MLGSVVRNDERQTVVLGEDDDSATIVGNEPEVWAQADAPLAPGTTLGRYEIIEELGRGGMGIVYRARDPTLDREVALKRLLGRQLGRRARQRLAREAQAMARLSHPNVVAVYDVSTDGDELLLAMEYVPGPTLRQWLKTSPPWTEVLRVFMEAAEGLAAAHERGMVHRDFKPGNVIVGTDGRARVLDFGIAVLGDDPSTLDGNSEDGSDGEPRGVPSTLTATGTVMGTPAYMAPEQHASRTFDPRVDQFAFCVALWEGLAGTRPFEGDYTDIIAAKFKGPPAWPIDSPVPRRIVDVLRRGLAVAPDDRWPDMRALLDALQPPRRGLSAGVIFGGLAIVAAAGVTWILSSSPSPCDHTQEELVGVWDAQRAEQAAQALRASEVVYANDAWPGIERSLDAFAESWQQQRDQACRATHVERTQSAAEFDLRMACLEQRRQALDAAVEALVTVGPDEVRSVLVEVADLPSPMQCADVEALASQMALPDDPKIAARVQAIRVELPRAHAWIDARDFDAVAAAVERLTAEAEATGYEPVKLEVELLAGRLLLATRRYDEGVARMIEAYERAGTLGHDRAAVEAAARIAVTEAVLLARPREGLTWAETAVAVAGRLPPGGESEALAQDALGRVLRVRGDLSGSVAAHTRALEIRERIHGPDRLITSMTRHRLGYALNLHDRPQEALTHLTRVRDDLERMLGPHHPEVAAILLTRAMALVTSGAFKEAEATYLRALEIHQATLEPDDPALAYVPLLLGDLYRKLEDPARALEYHQRALEIREAAYGSDDSRVATSLGTVADDHAKLGDLDTAERMHRRALRMLDDGHPRKATALNNLSTVLMRQGKLDEAEEALTESMALYEEAFGPDDPSLASPLTNLGRLRRTQGKAQEAETLHRRALQMRLSVHGARHVDVAGVQFNLAGALMDQGRHQEAVGLLSAAVRTLEDAAGSDNPSLAEPLLDLGRTQLVLQRYEDATQTLARARPMWVSTEGKASATVREIDELLKAAAAERSG